MIQRMLESAEFTSASPGHINTLIQVNAEDNPDFETEIKQLVKENGATTTSGKDDNNIKQQTKQTNANTKELKRLDKTNMAEINRLTSSQFGNIREIATDPTGFMVRTFLKRFAKGAGVIALAMIIFEAVKWVISEMLKPGRMLDIRFKRDINKEIIAFRRREEQQQIRQGFSSIIITTTPRLREGQGQITNTLNMAAGREKFPDQTIGSGVILQASGVSLSKISGRRGAHR